MALPSAELVKAAVEQLVAVFTDDKTLAGTRSAVQTVNELVGILNRLYGTPLDLALTDSADAGVSEFIGGGEGDALAVGDTFRTTVATNDLTDNALATAKGSAVAVGDIYVVSGADAVAYLGNNLGRVFDFAGETSADFVSLGS